MVHYKRNDIYLEPQHRSISYAHFSYQTLGKDHKNKLIRGRYRQPVIYLQSTHFGNKAQNSGLNIKFLDHIRKEGNLNCASIFSFPNLWALFNINTCTEGKSHSGGVWIGIYIELFDLTQLVLFPTIYFSLIRVINDIALRKHICKQIL